MVNYLYNGAERPALPEYDEGVYTYAFMRHTYTGLALNNRTSWLYLLKKVEYMLDSDSKWCIALDSENCLKFQCSDANFAWEQMDVSETEFVVSSMYNSDTRYLIWSNFDVLNEDGTLYLAASGPIPVNQAPTLDPTALLMGWQVGNRIRGGA